MKQLTLVIISHSSIISQGCAAMFATAAGRKISTVILTPSQSSWLDTASQAAPDIVVTDPLSLSSEQLNQLKSTCGPTTLFVGVYASALPSTISSLYDATLSLYASATAFESIIDRVQKQSETSQSAPTEELTPREKEIIIGVVKGLTNKEIASRLCVSIHTVMTHRRNISAKLQIHSPAALTIYAIVQKLIPVEDLNLPH